MKRYVEPSSTGDGRLINEMREVRFTFEGLLLTKEHPLNPYGEEWETNKVVIVFYDFEVLVSGYYDFTIVTENIQAKDEYVFKQSFEGFASPFGKEVWGYFELQ